MCLCVCLCLSSISGILFPPRPTQPHTTLPHLTLSHLTPSHPIDPNSAGLLPPIVNAGMLIAYAIAYAPKASRADFYEMGNYAILFYFSHVVTIVIIANMVFWLKDIDPRFRDGEDASFDDIPSLVEHKKRLEASGLEASGMNAERARAAYFVNNIKGDVKDLALDLKDKASGFANIVTGGLIGHR